MLSVSYGMSYLLLVVAYSFFSWLLFHSYCLSWLSSTIKAGSLSLSLSLAKWHKLSYPVLTCRVTPISLTTKFVFVTEYYINWWIRCNFCCNWVHHSQFYWIGWDNIHCIQQCTNCITVACRGGRVHVSASVSEAAVHSFGYRRRHLVDDAWWHWITSYYWKVVGNGVSDSY